MRRISTPFGTRLIEMDDRAAIHEFLLECAADIGNNDPGLPMAMKRRGVRPFIQADYLSGLEYLTLGFTDGALVALNQLPARIQKKTRKQLNDIATRALHQAILDNRDIFVGLVVGEARQGINYFESFEQFRDTV